MVCIKTSFIVSALFFGMGALSVTVPTFAPNDFEYSLHSSSSGKHLGSCHITLLTTEHPTYPKDRSYKCSKKTRVCKATRVGAKQVSIFQSVINWKMNVGFLERVDEGFVRLSTSEFLLTPILLWSLLSFSLSCFFPSLSYLFCHPLCYPGFHQQLLPIGSFCCRALRSTRKELDSNFLAPKLTGQQFECFSQ